MIKAPFDALSHDHKQQEGVKASFHALLEKTDLAKSLVTEDVLFGSQLSRKPLDVDRRATIPIAMIIEVADFRVDETGFMRFDPATPSFERVNYVLWYHDAPLSGWNRWWSVTRLAGSA